jgi:predicted HNH restriction endonuclease
MQCGAPRQNLHGVGLTSKADIQLLVHPLKPVSEAARMMRLSDAAVLCANSHCLAHSDQPHLPLESMRLLQA